MADNFPVRDGNGATVTLASKELTPGIHASKHVLLDASGNPINPARTEDITSLRGQLPSTIGTKLAAASLAVVPASDWVLPASENVIGAVVGKPAIVGASFTRPNDTTAYASGDLVANSVTAGSVVPLTIAAARINDGLGKVTRARLKKSGTSLTNAQFRVHLYKNDPSASTGITNGDNGAWLTKEATYLGSLDVTMDRAFSDMAKGFGVPNVGTEIRFDVAAGTKNIFALIEARAAYTPVALEVFTLMLEVEQS